jgi:hypothetical protein
MSYRVQIDVYEDRDKNKEQTEKEEKKSIKWVKRLIFTFLALMFIFYSKDLFNRVMIDGSKVKIENREDTTEYILETAVIRVTGQKDRDPEAIITLMYDQMPSESYTLRFSNPTDWEHSRVTVINKEGIAVFEETFQGFHVSMIKPDNQISILSASNRYRILAAMAFREVSKWKVNRLIYGVVCLLYIIVILSYKLWDWVFYRYQISWAIDRGHLPSFAYKLTMVIGRFIVLMLIFLLSVLSYDL